MKSHAGDTGGIWDPEVAITTAVVMLTAITRDGRDGARRLVRAGRDIGGCQVLDIGGGDRGVWAFWYGHICLLATRGLGRSHVVFARILYIRTLVV